MKKHGTRIYLAARYSRHPEMQQVARELEGMGYTITSRWIWGSHDIADGSIVPGETRAPLWGAEDWEDLVGADICLSFTEPPGEAAGRGRGGRHCEHGIALALDKRCIVVGYRENIFHWLEVVEFYATREECFMCLLSEALSRNSQALDPWLDSLPEVEMPEAKIDAIVARIRQAQEERTL